MIHAASFGWVYQPISYFSKEELAHADMVYDADDRPYKKEMTGQTEQAEKESVRIYNVNGEQVTYEVYQEMCERYWMLSADF